VLDARVLLTKREWAGGEEVCAEPSSMLRVPDVFGGLGFQMHEHEKHLETAVMNGDDLQKSLAKMQT
jgi:hypothetical protein